MLEVKQMTFTMVRSAPEHSCRQKKAQKHRGIVILPPATVEQSANEVRNTLVI